MRILFWAWPRLDVPGPRAAFGDSDPIYIGGGIHSFADIAKYSKTNTGNYVHLEAPTRFLDYDPALSSYFRPRKPISEEQRESIIEEINANFDVVSIGTANALRPDADMGGLARFVEKLNTKIFMFGLGLQQWFEPGLDNVQPGMKRFLEIADRKLDVWAVRGDRTNTWLKRSGIKSATTTGCPSLYSFPNKIISLAKKYAALKQAPDTVVGQKILTAGHLQRGRFEDPAKLWRATALNDLFKGCVADYVYQGEVRAYNKLKAEEFLYDPTTGELDADVIRKYFLDNFNFAANFRKYLLFLDASAWRVTASQYDVYIGDRLHGGIAAMQSGTPCILFHDDDRVKEIADYFLIPNYPTRDIAGKTLPQVVSEALVDFYEDRFVQNYLSRLTEFVNLIEKSGVSLRKHVTDPIRGIGQGY